jgi:hypothetical protein
MNKASLFAQGESRVEGSLKLTQSLIAIGNQKRFAVAFGLDPDSQDPLRSCETSELRVSEDCLLSNGTTLSITYGAWKDKETNVTTTLYR